MTNNVIVNASVMEMMTGMSKRIRAMKNEERMMKNDDNISGGEGR